MEQHKKALSSFSETPKGGREINKIWKSHYAMFMHNLLCHSGLSEWVWSGRRQNTHPEVQWGAEEIYWHRHTSLLEWIDDDNLWHHFFSVIQGAMMRKMWLVDEIDVILDFKVHELPWKWLDLTSLSVLIHLSLH